MRKFFESVSKSQQLRNSQGFLQMIAEASRVVVEKVEDQIPTAPCARPKKLMHKAVDDEKFVVLE